jgi:hypothetical protein
VAAAAVFGGRLFALALSEIIITIFPFVSSARNKRKGSSAEIIVIVALKPK